jgi:hypothetical protein
MCWYAGVGGVGGMVAVAVAVGHGDGDDHVKGVRWTWFYFLPGGLFGLCIDLFTTLEAVSLKYQAV